MKENQIQDEFIRQQFVQRENEIIHPTYDNELSYYDLIKSGNVTALKKTKSFHNTDDIERGVLSKNPIRNLLYHEIVNIAMITRFCIEGGLPEQEAYGLSDLYINQLDLAKTQDEIYQIQETFVMDFASRMEKLQKTNALSIYTKKAMDYVHNHLHENISVAQIAEELKIHETYLSKLFAKEMKQSLSQYIRQKRIQTAQNMLVYSDFTCTEIAQYFAFSSASHFAKVFQDITGQTPSQYRKTHYRKHWVE